MIAGGTYDALGFRAAKVARREGRTYQGGSGDYHLRYDRENLLNQSRAFARDNPLYRRLIDTATDALLGPNGFTLRSKARNQKKRKDIEERWRRWSEDPEVRGLHDWAGIEDIVVRDMLEAGDIAGLKIRTEGRLQVHEAENICSHKRKESNGKRIEDGVQLDYYGRPTGFYLAPTESASGRPKKTGAKMHQARDVIFLANQRRISETRGYPALTSAFSMLHRLNDVLDAEAVSWQMLARIAFLVSSNSGRMLPSVLGKADPQKTSSDTDGDAADRLVNLDVGLAFIGKEGEEVKAAPQGRPHNNFEQSVRMFMRLMGLPLGLPLELIFLDWSASNFSSARTCLEQAFRRFLKLQRTVMKRWHARAFRWKAGTWHPNDTDALEHEWILPPFPWIDQLKEAQAWEKKIDRGLASHADACAALNQEREDLMNAVEAEIRDAVQRAKKLGEELDETIPWQLFAGRVIGKTEAAEKVKQPEEAKPIPKSEKPDADDDDDEEEDEDA